MVAAADAMTTGKRFSAGLPPVPAAITMLSLVATRRGQPPQAGQVHERTSKLAFHRPVEQHFLTFPLHTLGPAHISRDSGPPGSASEECDHVKSRDHKDHNHPATPSSQRPLKHVDSGASLWHPISESVKVLRLPGGQL